MNPRGLQLLIDPLKFPDHRRVVARRIDIDFREPLHDSGNDPKMKKIKTGAVGGNLSAPPTCEDQTNGRQPD
jgi:hypothetical protein